MAADSSAQDRGPALANAMLLARRKIRVTLLER